MTKKKTEDKPEFKSVSDLLPDVKESIKEAAKPKRIVPRTIFDELFTKHENLVLQARKKDFTTQYEYEINDVNRDIVECIKMYFCLNPDFNKAGVISNEASLNKGILIHGDNGVGKSLLFDILHEVGRELMVRYNYNGIWFNIIAASSFVDLYMREVTKKEKNERTNFDLRHYYKGKLYIDDLGKEKLAFGRDEIFTEIIDERYKSNFNTYLTTNLSPSAIGKRYGIHIGDRIVEMFNLIKWKGDSFRK